jgi:hypothetical protein
MSDKGKSSLLDAAKAMAMTAVDLLLDPTLIRAARVDLDNYLQN